MSIHHFVRVYYYCSIHFITYLSNYAVIYSTWTCDLSIIFVKSSSKVVHPAIERFSFQTLRSFKWIIQRWHVGTPLKWPVRRPPADLKITSEDPLICCCLLLHGKRWLSLFFLNQVPPLKTNISPEHWWLVSDESSVKKMVQFFRATNSWGKSNPEIYWREASLQQLHWIELIVSLAVTLPLNLYVGSKLPLNPWDKNSSRFQDSRHCGMSKLPSDFWP